MKKFLNLLTKEIRELVTLQLIGSLVFTFVLFYFIGQLAKSEAARAAAPQKIAALDLDRSDVSRGLLDNLRSINYIIEPAAAADKEAAVEAVRRSPVNFLLVIPAGFGEAVSRFETREVETYTFMRSFSMSATRNSAVFRSVIAALNRYMSDEYLKQRIAEIPPENLKNPIKSRDFVVIKDRQAQGSAGDIAGFVFGQSIFVPIILMMIIIYSSQMVISAIAMEKQNKTLETLLTVPIRRSSIVTAKMLASGLVGLLSAAIYMVGFRFYMRGFTGDMRVGAEVSQVIEKLGLVLDAKGYIILGVSLFFAILCALALAIILGVLAEDFRSAQSLIMPVVFLVLIPYFISFFADFRTLSLPVKIFILAIPFSHPFLATQNILLENYQAVALGILYMVAVFILLVGLAARIFSTDRVLTMKLRWGRKKVVL
ncbi:MAG: ABC transporter [Candidatus Aminicenantes bacterium RBG_13_62_12]|nr:MAG: ABC transporter [Candidatus Aminicenantes bacterium RBG_13_62_12]